MNSNIPIPNWIATSSKEITLGFDTLAEAEAFLRSQTSNVEWISQWSLSIKSPYGKEAVFASAPSGLSLSFKKESNPIDTDEEEPKKHPSWGVNS